MPRCNRRAKTLIDRRAYAQESRAVTTLVWSRPAVVYIADICKRSLRAIKEGKNRMMRGLRTVCASALTLLACLVLTAGSAQAATSNGSGMGEHAGAAPAKARILVYEVICKGVYCGEDDLVPKTKEWYNPDEPMVGGHYSKSGKLWHFSYELGYLDGTERVMKKRHGNYSGYWTHNNEEVTMIKK